MGTATGTAGRARRSLLVVALLGLVAAVGLVGPRLVAAQGATPAAGEAGATLRVVGTGTVTVAPDTAAVTVGVDVTEETLTAAQTAATERMEAILAAVEAAGVADADVQTAYFGVNPIRAYDEMGNPGEVTGYQVTNQVSVQVRDLDTVGTLLEGVVEAGANSIFGVSFYLADPSEAAAEARERAVADAAARADGLAAAAGQSVGEIRAIAETFAPGFVGDAKGQGQAAGAPPIQPGTTTVTVNVEVTYALT